MIKSIIEYNCSIFLTTGRSLIWVAILGMIIIYIYALVGFAFFRPVFKDDEEQYCNTLYECTVTVIRYGVVGDISEVGTF